MYDGFLSPPKGYGNVPFYWWTGDRLNKERITEQLTELAGHGVSGVQINFAHDSAARHHIPGNRMVTLPCDPETFSDEWWDIMNHAARTAKSLGMKIGISDYTIAWLGNGFFVDQIAEVL